ncbi:WAT1-related protein At1g09380-like [Quercus robur]|uniref:WAT1-related protein At1g09380-like n=1 Tax=Quercus robur TaxID=38942 RepID=UPI0021639C93|nr:WAT1-related protein At1g09380-like [Quercus robur]
MNLYKDIKVAVVNHQTVLAMILIQLSYAGMALISKAAFNEGMSPLVLNAYRQAIATIVLAPFAFLLERSFNKYRIQVTSHIATSIDLYSASAVDLETVFCFLDFQETNESPKKTQKPVMDLLESGQVAQSASAKAFMCSEVFDGNNNP